MIFDILQDYFNDLAKYFIAHTHIYLYSIRKNLAMLNFYVTCRVNKDYVYYKTHPIGYFTKKLELFVDKDI